MPSWPGRPLAWAALALLTSCKDVTSYSNAPDENYCGSVIQGPFVRAGLSPSVQMRLHLDADSLASAPGTLSTSDGLLQNAPMLAIPQLFHDPLSTLEFGEGRRRNLFYVVSPTRPGSPVSVVISLMESGDVEVRLLRGAQSLDAQAPPGDSAIFGVFPLQRRKGNCGI